MELIVRDSTFFMRSFLIIVCCVQWSENLNSLVYSKVGETEHLAIVFLVLFPCLSMVFLFGFVSQHWSGLTTEILIGFLFSMIGFCFV